MALYMKNKFKIFLPDCTIQAGVCLLFFLICYVNNGHAQTNDSSDSSASEVVAPPYQQKDSLQELNDSNAGKISFDDSDKIIKWKQSREFAYMHYLDSLLRIQKDFKSDTVSINEVSGKIIRNHRSVKGSGAFNKILNSLPLKIFFWTLALIFIAFIGYRVLFKNGTFTIKKKKVISESDEELSIDLGDFFKYDALISEAENDKNFNLATRYLYLKTLKNLSEKGLINFVPDKTNLDYLHEMETGNYFGEFQSLTHNYEYLWYGKFLIGEKNYQYLKEEFILFNKKV